MNNLNEKGGPASAKLHSEDGFIKLIILIVIILIILGYYGYNIQDILQSPSVHNNLVYVWNGVKTLWINVLATPATYIWNNIIVGILWKLFSAGIGKVDINTITQMATSTGI